jgi:2-polyprenyl-6-methoxyphenol hydroxylase-like FAD-dependent oxidoreductase
MKNPTSFEGGAVLDARSFAPDDHCDVLVVGGGPAGSTIAALLASRGERVVLVEKDRHPRFHIGESLLPMNVPLFEQLGVSEEIERIGMPKYGVEFVSPWHNKSISFDFADAFDKSFPSAFQVRRSEVDHILLNNAAAKGATVIEGCRVSSVEFPEEGGVIAAGTGEHGETLGWRARFLVDATGRDTLMANHLAIKQRNRRHNTAAVYGHFTGARRLAGKAAGNITIFWFDHGWFWFIPLSDETTSIGAVCRPEFLKSRNSDVTTFLHKLIAMCPALAERLADATIIGPATATGNYSYQAERMTGRNFIMVGDAFAFIDPVFSTGVFLAMKGAFLGADAVTACLHRPQDSDRALRRFEAEVRQAIARFSWYIYRVNRPAMQDLFMAPRNYLRIQEAMLSLLSGDVFRRSPIRWRLLLFKGLFYVKSAIMAQTAPRGRLSRPRGTVPTRRRNMSGVR